MAEGNDLPAGLANGYRVRIKISNFITPNLDLVIQNPVLVQGVWEEPPKPLVPWQESRTAVAAGPAPTGVQGSLAFRIATSELSKLNFTFNINSRSSNVDGSQSKFIVYQDRLFVAEVKSSPGSNPYDVELNVSGGT